MALLTDYPLQAKLKPLAGELGGHRSVEKGRASKATLLGGYGVGSESEVDGLEVVRDEP